MISQSTDSHWEQWGRRDPYFGVITNDGYRSTNLTEEGKQAFFESGHKHVARVLATSRRYIDPDFAPRSALDFGCGVGRVVIPLAAVVEQVVGLDVSSSMLEEARRNCASKSLSNVHLLQSDDALSCIDRRFDLVHSFIVFQHIPQARGRQIFSRLLDCLDDGGIGAVHFAYSKARYRAHNGRIPLSRTLMEPFVRIKRIIRSRLPGRDPEMEMNPYDLNELSFMMQSAGIRDLHAEYTDNGGQLGVFMYFRKPAPI